ncbi:MAG: hypothetical protein H7Z19_05475, partial [Chitinophagaceae bacterium]|nr:hypothetical protein [Rubrivivax sp.]
MRMPGRTSLARGFGRCVQLAALLAACLAIGGCTSLPKLDPPPVPSQSLPLSPQTALGRLALASVSALTVAPVSPTVPEPSSDEARMPDGSEQGLSGFRLLPLGTHSLDARLQLVHHAQGSLDLQYYHFAVDSTGRALLRALRDAAARGVR